MKNFLIILILSVSLSFAIEPDDYSGLKVWLRSDLGITFSDEDSISTWADQSEQNNDATQTTAGERPRLINDFLNGKPVVRFDSLAWFQIAEVTEGVNQSFFIVVNFLGDGPHGTVIGSIGNVQDYGTGLRHYISTTWMGWFSINNDNGVKLIKTSLELDYFYIISVVQSEGYNKMYWDGIEKVSSDSMPNPYTGWDVRIGMGTNCCPLEGYIAEIIGYDRLLTELERKEIEYYLSQRYNIGDIEDPSLSFKYYKDLFSKSYKNGYLEY